MKILTSSYGYKLVLLITIILCVFLRLSNLAYSDFQGDEVFAQNYLFGNQNLINFLLSRPVGPGQFVVSYVANIIFRSSNILQFWVRLPFCLAGIFSCFTSYIVLRKFSNPISGIFSFAFVSISGLFIAFSRIVQYQSFVTFISVLCVYLIFTYRGSNKNIHLIMAGIISGVGLLFHYDYLSFFIPSLLYLFKFYGFKKTLGLYLIPALALALIFYIPFVLHNNFANTWSYLIETRVASDIAYDSLYYSLKLFNIYHPKEMAFFLVAVLFTSLVTFIKDGKTVLRPVLICLCVLIIARVILVQPNTLLIILSIVSAGLLFYSHYKNTSAHITSFIALWGLFSFIVYGLLIRMPLTHMYTYIFPLLLLAGVQIYNLTTNRRAVQRIALLITLPVLVFAVHYNYRAFIDTSPEFPWNRKYYLGGSMPNEISHGEFVDGIFGFPYNRNWKAISSDMTQLKNKYGFNSYGTNEKYRLSKYYIQNYRWVEQYPQISVWIKKPQSLSTAGIPTGVVLKESSTYTIVKEQI